MARRITIKSIALKEWRGQNHKITLKDGRNVLRGRNSCGKTSIYEAFVWVLSGYTNPNSPKNHNLYNNREELSKDTPYASVTITLSIDGVDYTIERKASPNFVRRRASSEWEKASSDKYLYYIDNIEVSVAISMNG